MPCPASSRPGACCPDRSVAGPTELPRPNHSAYRTRRLWASRSRPRCRSEPQPAALSRRSAARQTRPQGQPRAGLPARPALDRHQLGWIAGRAVRLRQERLGRSCHPPARRIAALCCASRVVSHMGGRLRTGHAIGPEAALDSVAVSHPALGLPPLSSNAGLPAAGARLRAARERLGARALEIALELDPTIREHNDQTGSRLLLRDMGILVDEVAN